MTDMKLPLPKVQEGMDLVDSMTAEELNLLVDYIRYVYRAKRNQDAGRAFATIKVGDRVQIGNSKPQYLTGQTGEVIEKKNSRILILLDGGPVGKFKTGKVLCPPNTLKVID